MIKFSGVSKALAYFIPLLTAAIVIITIFVSSIPPNTLTPHYEVLRIVNSLFPEGWSFFTRSPREEAADLYKIEGEKIKKVNFCNADPKNFFGLSRKSRRIGMEISLLASDIPNSAWKLVPDLSAEIVKDIPSSNKQYNGSSVIKQGRYIVSVFKPIPWLWSKHVKKLHRKLKVTVVDVR